MVYYRSIEVFNERTRRCKSRRLELFGDEIVFSSLPSITTLPQNVPQRLRL